MICEFRYGRGSGELARTPLVAYWEVSCDPISDDYTPQEIDAADLFHLWVKTYRKDWHNDLIPIGWYVRGKTIFEFFPHQYDHTPALTAQYGREDFLSFFSHPVDPKTKEPINWLKLPVVDKAWKPGRSDKGGFIQEATGWKPSILQPFIHLDALMSAVVGG